MKFQYKVFERGSSSHESYDDEDHFCKCTLNYEYSLMAPKDIARRLVFDSQSDGAIMFKTLKYIYVMLTNFEEDPGNYAISAAQYEGQNPEIFIGNIEYVASMIESIVEDDLDRKQNHVTKNQRRISKN